MQPIKICLWCQQDLTDAHDGYCSRRCREQNLRTIASDREIDWFRVKLVAEVIRSEWKPWELQARSSGLFYTPATVKTVADCDLADSQGD